jgi:hypothetical protein
VPSLGRRPPWLGPPARPAQTTSLTTHTYMFSLHTPFHPRMDHTRGFLGGDSAGTQFALVTRASKQCQVALPRIYIFSTRPAPIVRHETFPLRAHDRLRRAHVRPAQNKRLAAEVDGSPPWLTRMKCISSSTSYSVAGMQMTLACIHWGFRERGATNATYSRATITFDDVLSVQLECLASNWRSKPANCEGSFSNLT